MTTAESCFRELSQALPGSAIHYAVKANPHPQLLRRLANLGCHFDVASPAEVRSALNAGADVTGLVFSNPVKRRADIIEATEMGVRLFVVDSIEETHKMAEASPGAQVLCRIVTSGEGSDWPLSRKYGCSVPQAIDILLTAARRGLVVAGLSFHVGSQQRDPDAWDAPIEAASRVFARLREEGISPWLLDLGGGFPADHQGNHPGLPTYGSAIAASLERHFGADRPQTLVEPGRAIVADAGRVVSTVVAVVTRADIRWVFLDVGVFTGLVETLDEAIRYRITTNVDGGPIGPAVLAGPTCDSADVMYEKQPVLLPESLAEGDQVVLHSAGAYTSCYSTVGFNGFDPLPTYLV